MKIERFEDLEIWQEARMICKEIFVITSVAPFSKDFKFRNQIRSSSGSIMDNIAEGFERGGNNEFFQFLSIAKGSCGETRSQLYRSLDFNYISKEKFEELSKQTIRLSKRISSFMNHLKNSSYKGSKYK